MIHKGGVKKEKERKTKPEGTQPLVLSHLQLVFLGSCGASEGQALSGTAPSHHWPFLQVDGGGSI